MLTYQLPENLGSEILDLERLINEYEAGKIDANELKAHRVPFGIYEQRKDDSFMVRIRCAGGIITPLQLKKVAELSNQYGTSYIHLTTRQEVQIHDVDLSDVIDILRELQTVGLSSRGGGGNTIRNIMTDVYSGIHKDEVFDVTPYAVALTTQLICEKDSWRLPRKYKISFSSSPADRGLATINDLGFIAAERKGKQGFCVYIAGGMGARSELAKPLYDFILPEEIYPIAKGLKNLFDKKGNRRNKHDARIRFLWNNLGEEKFRALLEEEISQVKLNDPRRLEWPVIENSSNMSLENTFTSRSRNDYTHWKERYLISQKQKELYAIRIPIALGNIDNDLAILWADFLQALGENCIRISQDQNFVIRNVPDFFVNDVFEFCKQHFPLSQQSVQFSSIRACAGASTCKLGIGLSRGLATAVNKELSDSSIDLDRVQDVKVNISGCPNSCGQHMIADLGYFGKASRRDSHLYPAYNVVVGAHIEQGKSRFARTVGAVSARDIPEFHRRVLSQYSESSSSSFNHWLEGPGEEWIKALIEEYKEIPSFEEDKNYYFDWGAEQLFSLEGRGVGECSAGIFDLIDVDVKNIEAVKQEISMAGETDKADKLYQLVLYASRMLLVTQGIEAKNEGEVFEQYLETFINPCLVEDKFKTLIQSAQKKDMDDLLQMESLCVELSDTMVELYQNMDNSLHFHVQQKPVSDKQIAAAESKRFKDLRGVACPMNFVKVKIELASMQKGDVLEVLLDDGQPIQNVPGSVRSEGHKVLAQDPIADHWGLTIQKA